MDFLEVKGEDYIQECIEIGRQLPVFFTEQGLESMAADLENDILYIAVEEEKITGFITIKEKNDDVAEVSWMAVDPTVQRQGIGAGLIEKVAVDLKEAGFQVLEVKTLSERADYEPYEKTRAFYRKVGFVLLETIDPYEPWDPESPCAIYVKVL